MTGQHDDAAAVAAANSSHYGSGDKGGQFAPKGQDGASSPSAVADEFASRKQYGGLQGTSRGSGSSAPTPAEPPANLTKGTLKRGGNNDPAAVTQLQQMLADLKIGSVTPDGTFGTQTELAVKAAQMKLGLKPTGRAGPGLTRRLIDAHALSPCVGGGDAVAAAAGHDVTPGHDELHHWWIRGPGLARWAGSPTPWTTLLANLQEEVHDKPLETLKRWASAWYIEVFHYAPGSDKARVAHGKPPRGHVVGPG